MKKKLPYWFDTVSCLLGMGTVGGIAFYWINHNPSEWMTPALLIAGYFAVITIIASYVALDPPGPGTCETCGYDLRATPNRCPECGTLAKQKR